MTKTDSMKRVVQRLAALGFVFSKDRSGHSKMYMNGRMVWALPATPSDKRSFLNLRTDLTHRLRELGAPPTLVADVRRAIKP